MDEHPLEGFRRDLQNPARVLHEPVLLGRRDVSVPMRDGDTGLVAKLGDASELVVDEGFERRDIDDPDGLRHIVVELRKNGEKRRLGLAGSGLGRQEEIILRVKENIGGGDLDLAEMVPAAGIDKLPHKRAVFVENGHGWAFLTCGRLILRDLSRAYRD